MSNINNIYDDLKFLIPRSLEYYDKNVEDYEPFFNNVYDSKTIQNDKDMERNKILFYNKKNDVILESEYEIIGLFYKKYNLWSWGWAIPSLKKNETYIIKKLLNYALDIDISRTNNKSFGFIKTELINSRSKITDELQLHIHLALASYLSKNKIIYKRKYYLSEEPEDFIIYYLFILKDPK